jgi:hypothetical protein
MLFGKLPPNTLAGFDLTTHSSNLLGVSRRRYHSTTRPGRIWNAYGCY